MRNQAFLDQIDEVTLGALREAGVRERFGRDSYLFFQDDSSTAVYLVEEGAVRVERHSSGGPARLIDLMMPGELLGELGVLEGRPRSMTAVAISETTTLLTIPADRFLELFDAVPDLARGTVRWLSLRLRGQTDRFLEATHAPASARVCARLLQLMAFNRATTDPPVVVVMPISQADLAEWAGLSREATVKALRELRRDGVLETSRGRVLVLQPDELTRRAAAVLP